MININHCSLNKRELFCLVSPCCVVVIFMCLVSVPSFLLILHLQVCCQTLTRMKRCKCKLWQYYEVQLAGYFLANQNYLGILHICVCDAVTLNVCVCAFKCVCVMLWLSLCVRVCSQRLPEESRVLGRDEGAEQSCISLPEGLGPGPQLPGEWCPTSSGFAALDGGGGGGGGGLEPQIQRMYEIWNHKSSKCMKFFDIIICWWKPQSPFSGC